MKIPSLPREGVAVAETVTEIIKFLRASQITTVKGGRIKGNALEITPPDLDDVTSAPPFEVSAWEEPEGTFQYSVEPGYVTYQNIGSGGTGYVTPTLDGTTLEAEERPVGTLPAASCYVYCRVTTTNKGVPNGATITASSSSQSDTHHQPPDAQNGSGVAGVYYLLLAQFTDDGNGHAKVSTKITGNRNMPNQLVEFSNIGGGKEIHRDFLNATDKHELRSIKERVSAPQINVKYDNEGSGDPEDAESIIVEGNDNDGTLLFEDCNGNALYSLTWEDGLITTASQTIVVPDCPSTTT